MPARDLLIVGSGGFARETAQLAAVHPGWRLLGFCDDAPSTHGTVVDGVRVLGPVEDSVQDTARRTDAQLVVCVGKPGDYGSRARIVARLDRLGVRADRYATLVHPTASVGPSCTLGPGCVLLAQTVLTASVRLGAHVAVMPHVTLTHDDVVEDFVTVASGVRLGGGVRVGTGAYIGAGALVREGLRIGPGSLVGMGSLVLTDVPAEQVWVGSPARFLRTT
ncbi:acetyltransferase [Actinopolymorpha singaporensis]|uniref:Sugar O-acyltransferase, sialic acid O-acetyltransferase NeuD family n=1 Tax=Actinopolymorpha singaporensis TaxID=117157 RepID=A0A1H1RMV7_9ACTN|nr:acetyltransferase [Actinopolymorpha singaporensis]SDS37034.1 sugar O-acyltransferase, sialic acid O-acetyltransferase NeuD family [Actinopolymorpha singaporensis]